MVETENIIYNDRSNLREESIILLFELSHICLTLPVKLNAISESKKLALFIVEENREKISVEQWEQALTFSASYKIQNFHHKDENNNFIYSVNLIDKKVFDGKLLLYLRVNMLDNKSLAHLYEAV